MSGTPSRLPRQLPWRARARRCQDLADADAARLSDEQLQQQPVLLEAWIAQRTEWTKSVFAISSAAVGILAAALLNKDALTLQPLTKLCLGIGTIAFIIAVTACLQAFLVSADSLKRYVSPDPKVPGPEALEPELNRIESLQHHGFVFGILLLACAAFFEHAVRP